MIYISLNWSGNTILLLFLKIETKLFKSIRLFLLAFDKFILLHVPIILTVHKIKYSVKQHIRYKVVSI